MNIGIESSFTINLSPASSRDSTSEVHQALDRFEAASPIMFKQRELFNIMLYKRRLRHRDLLNKENRTREFDRGDIVVVSNQVKSSIKYKISHKLIFKT